MNQIYGRVAPKTNLTQFYRCALLFTVAWAIYEVDQATKERLEAEQMLEITDLKPLGFGEEPVEGGNKDEAAGAASGESTAADDALAEQADKSAEPAAPETPAETAAPAAAENVTAITTAKAAKPKAAK